MSVELARRWGLLFADYQTGRLDVEAMLTEAEEIADELLRVGVRAGWHIAFAKIGVVLNADPSRQGEAPPVA